MFASFRTAPVVACLLVGTLTCQVHADGPSILSMFRKKQQVGKQALGLKAEHGPWLILAATLSGEDAKRKATALATEIRTSLKLPSYILEKTFDNSGVLGSTTQLVNEVDGSTTQYRAWTQYANGEREQVYAVLVGDFTSTEDPRIAQTLNIIRTAQPLALGGGAAKGSGNPSQADSSNWLVQKYRSLIWSRTDRELNQKKGPMGAAFVTRNPLLPDDFFQTANKVDKFVEGLNKQVQYSLLDCKGRFTVRVASFYGYAATDLGNKAPNKLNNTSDALDKAAERANKLTLALRAQGAEAYQFHDRFGSYVTIGSFDHLGREVGNGGFEYTSEMVALMERYCGYRVIDVKDPRTGALSRRTSLKSLDKIPFDAEGKPMAVPRAETSNLYRGSLLGGR